MSIKRASNNKLRNFVKYKSTVSLESWKFLVTWYKHKYMVMRVGEFNAKC